MTYFMSQESADKIEKEKRMAIKDIKYYLKKLSKENELKKSYAKYQKVMKELYLKKYKKENKK